MFKEIINALRRKDRLNELFREVGEMLTDAEWMFTKASDVLIGEADWSAIADELYDRDRRINEKERHVREGIVRHLTVADKTDLGPCLVLMSVVKDAERIGDYCKNIFEVGKFYRRAYTHPEYAGPLEEIRANARPLFDQAGEAFVEADKNVAHKVLGAARGLTRECDLLIRQLLTRQQDLASDEAVAYVLLARFYKRVTAHLANIATSVVSPVPMLDYHEKQR